MSKKNKHHDRETGGVALATDVEEHPSQRHKDKAGAAAYSNGNPLDQIQYLEAKLVLKPDRFTSVESFRDFGKLVKRTAKGLKVGFTDDPEAGRRPQIREIVFADTSDYRLYNHAFILRRRISYVDGFPVGDPEIVFKFRHPDEQKTAGVDVRPHISGKYRIKFKAEALPLKDRICGFRTPFRHNRTIAGSASARHRPARTRQTWPWGGPTARHSWSRRSVIRHMSSRGNAHARREHRRTTLRAIDPWSRQRSKA